MASGAHTGDSPPTKLHSAVTPNAAIGSRTYAEYQAKLQRSDFASSAPIIQDELWLASFDGAGRCLEWNYHVPSGENSLNVPRNLPALDGNGVRPHTTVVSSHDFRTLLRNPDEHVAYRIFIVTVGNKAIASRTKDVLGLGLDLRPEIFEYAQMCVENPNSEGRGVFPRSWHKFPPALRVGANALCVLEAGLEKATNTGICNLPVSYNYIS